jgi:hypothetical protein
MPAGISKADFKAAKMVHYGQSLMAAKNKMSRIKL